MEQRVREEQMGGEEQGRARACEKCAAGYYAICTIGGMLSAGTTHLVTTPLDVLKVNMQVHAVLSFINFLFHGLLILSMAFLEFINCEPFLVFYL